jgi:outer membrane lipoprotein-sorting protein
MKPTGVVVLAIAVVVLGAIAPATTAVAAPPATTAIGPNGVDPDLWRQMTEIDARAARIDRLTCDFQQQKFTALLKRPIVSHGKVRIAGPVMRWDTIEPEPSVLVIEQSQAEIYYPSEKTLEVYDLGAQLGQLAASPLPRLDVLVRYFTFEQATVADFNAAGATATAPPAGDESLAVRLKPVDPNMTQYVKEVLVLLDRTHGFITRARMTDADGDRTSITFTNLVAGGNFDAASVRMTTPSGTKVVHPLGAAGSSGG